MPSLVPFETIPQLVDGLTHHYAGQQRVVMRYKDKRTKEWIGISWTALMDDVHAMMGYLHSTGVRPGDRVAILSENRPEWAITDLATQLLGAINVALYTTLPASQVGYIVKDAGAQILIVSTSMQLRKAESIFDECPDLERVVTMSDLRGEHPEYVEAWEAALETGRAYYADHTETLQALGRDVTPDSLSALIYTSGTTGEPKGVMLTHCNFASNATAALDRFDFGPNDHHLSFLPLCHSFERTAGYTVVLACGALISYAESVDTVSKNLLEVSPTVMISVPRLFEKVYTAVTKSVEEGSAFKKKIFGWSVGVGQKAAERRSQGRSLGPILAAEQKIAHKLVFSKLHDKLGGNLRFAVSGGAALPKAIGEFFRAAGVTIVEGYGLTETSPVLTANPLDAPRYGTVGRVLGGVTVGIMRDGKLIAEVSGDDASKATINTEEGEIVAKGPNIMKGYWNNEASTREAIDAKGWYHTGDVGRFVNGYLQITDRIKHMIVSKGGKNIYPGPIEDSFKTEPLIDQVMVIGEGREFLTALVVPNFDAAQTLTGTDSEDAAFAHPDLKAHFETFFREYSKGAASHEKIRGFRLVREPFTVENELMTPTMKLKRKAIEAQYADTIDEMYAAMG